MPLFHLIINRVDQPQRAYQICYKLLQLPQLKKGIKGVYFSRTYSFNIIIIYAHLSLCVNVIIYNV